MSADLSFAEVSVILPCYCAEETVERAIQSIALQTLPPLEVVAIDDASTDGTYGILKSLKEKYRWLSVIRLGQNLGPSVARNFGWEKATQPYLAFLDADDSWHPRKLEVQYNWMMENPNVMLSGHPCVHSNDTFMHSRVPVHYRVRHVTKWPLLVRNCLLTPSTMLRRELPFRFDSSKRHSEDYLLWCQIVLSGYKTFRLEVPLSYVHKAPFGERGLSADLWKMEVGELDTYYKLFKMKLISYQTLIALWLYSFAKFINRFIHIGLRRCFPK